MEKALLQKEWIKTRRVFCASLVLALALALYAVLMMNRLIELKGGDNLWLIMLLKDNTFIDIIKYSPAAIGIAVGAAQMIPEMTQKRLKLTLHLPYPQRRLITLMLGAGLGGILLIFLIQLGIIVAYDLTILPHELVWRVALTALPWYFAGCMAYLFTASICLEGTWRRRIVLALLGIAALMVMFLQPAPEAYNGMLPMLLCFTILLTILSFGSVIRFKEGRQD